MKDVRFASALWTLRSLREPGSEVEHVTAHSKPCGRASRTDRHGSAPPGGSAAQADGCSR